VEIDDSKYATTGPQTISSVFGHLALLWYYPLTLCRSSQDRTHGGYRLDLGGVFLANYVVVGQ
jgi:hypothetical protein